MVKNPRISEKAIEYYEQALQVRTRVIVPRDWATTLNNLGLVYHRRLVGDREDNLDQAIALYNQALEVRLRNVVPEEWAATMHNLGFAYSLRKRGNPTENIERAIGYYKQALQVRTKTASPLDWAQTQQNLDIVLRGASSVAQQDHATSISHFETVQIVCPRCGGTYSGNLWHIIDIRERPDLVDLARKNSVHNLKCTNCGQVNLVDSYILLYDPKENMPLTFSMPTQTTGEADNIELNKALSLLRKTTESSWNDEWVANIRKISRLLLPYSFSNDLEEYKNKHKKEYLTIAFAAFSVAPDKTKKILMIELMPELLSKNIDLLISEFIQKAKAQNRSREEIASIEYIQTLLSAAREFGVERAFGFFSIIPSYLPKDLQEKIYRIEKMDPSKESAQIISICNELLGVISREKEPMAWARLNVLLGKTLIQGDKGKKIENVERALLLYKQVLEICSLEKLPFEHGFLLQNIGSLYLMRNLWRSFGKLRAGYKIS